MSQQINLFNPIFLQKKKYFSALTMVQGLGMIALGVALLAAYAAFELSRLRPEARAITAQLEAARAQFSVVQAQTERRRDPGLEAEVQRMEAQVLAMQRVADKLRANEGVAMTDGYSDYMGAFARQIVDGLWLTSFSIDEAGGQISISGAAVRPELIPLYLQRLGREHVLRGKAFDVLEMASAPTEGKSRESDGAIVFRLGASRGEHATSTGGAIR